VPGLRTRDSLSGTLSKVGLLIPVGCYSDIIIQIQKEPFPVASSLLSLLIVNLRKLSERTYPSSLLSSQ
jgi:hypothetical protein